MKEKKNWHPATKAVRLQMDRTYQGEHASPLFLTSSFAFETSEDIRAAFAEEHFANTYSRYTNPNVEELSNKIAALENAEAAFSVASGMAAIFGTFMALLKSGDHIICSRSIFGGTNSVITKYLPKFGIEYTYVDAVKTEEWEKAIKANTKMIYFETPTNPQLEIIDLAAVSAMAKQHNILTVVDNCFATPVLQRPIDFGIDVVIHSATKWMDGQGRVLAGSISGSKELINEVYLFCRATGPTLSPFNAWMISKSLETLDVRLERHCANALKVAQALETHPKINLVKYPFLQSHPQYDIAKRQMYAGGGIVCLDVHGGLAGAQRFIDNLEMLTITSNLGDSRSIVSHPTTTTHSRLTEEERLSVGITPGLIRLSLGLEYVDDILDDINQALEHV